MIACEDFHGIFIYFPVQMEF